MLAFIPLCGSLLFMTLEKSTEVVDDEEVPCLKFRLKNEEKVITYGEIGARI